MGFHMLDLVVILLIGLALFGPKALQSMARSAGRGVSQAKEMKNKMMSELPLEEISEVSRQISRVPMSPQQAVHMLITQEANQKSTEKAQVEEKKPE
jgi:Sec-independent protein translocase protein TatA